MLHESEHVRPERDVGGLFPYGIGDASGNRESSDHVQVGLGDGGEKTLLRHIRVHGNFGEYVPFILMLMLMGELLGAPVDPVDDRLGAAEVDEERDRQQRHRHDVTDRHAVRHHCPGRPATGPQLPRCRLLCRILQTCASAAEFAVMLKQAMRRAGIS